MKNRDHEPSAINRLRELGRKRKHARQIVGAAPGAIFQTPGAGATSTQAWSIGSGNAQSTDIAEFEQVKRLYQERAEDSLLWIDIRGLANTDLIQSIGQLFGLHPLVVADVVNVGQKPKAEVHDDDYIVVLLREPLGGFPFDSEQLAIVIGPGFVLTLQERQSDLFDPVRKRLVEGSRRLYQIGASYLGYELMDAVVDGYFPILEGYGEQMEALEQRVIEQANPNLITDIHVIKRELLGMRRALWSQREAINILLREDTELIPDTLTVYLRDLADHSFQLLDMVEVYREISQGLVDLHMSSVSNRMNEIMRVLTVIATIFIPMTFIAGLYGMNFDTSSPWNMPELKWPFGYFYSLGLMGFSALMMLIYFWRKGLIGKK